MHISSTYSYLVLKVVKKAGSLQQYESEAGLGRGQFFFWVALAQNVFDCRS